MDSITLTFDSSLEDIASVNKSFSAGKLRICYTGQNRNKTALSRDAIERAIPTMYNCPVVCNYDVETDTIGGHDMTVVRNDAGELRLIHLTDAVGVIPNGANTWWEDYGGHDYFCTEVILWKRSPAFAKIERDGIVGHSMEIGIERSVYENGTMNIEEFEFQAFCLLGDGNEPCFEDSALELFSMRNVSDSLAEMMQEYKREFSLVQSSNGVDIHNITEGGDNTLNEKLALVAEFGLDVDTLDFALDDFSIEELRSKFTEMTAAASEEPDSADEPDAVFALEGQLRDELITAIEAEQVDTPFGQMPRYMFMDYDRDASEVYVYDVEDWNLYGFTYVLNGDAVAIDYETKKRMKFAVVPFEGEDAASPFAAVYSNAVEQYTAQLSENEASLQSINSMSNELEQLRAFKLDVENERAEIERETVFAQFEDLSGIEAFEVLRQDAAQYSIDDLEEKCFAIRGRNSSVAKFSVEPKAPRLVVDPAPVIEEPYGDLFEKYGDR